MHQANIYTQSEYIKDGVLNVLNQWFPKSQITGFKAGLYIEVLSGYTKDIISKAMEKLKASWVQQSPPQPAHLKELCDEVCRHPAQPQSLVKSERQTTYPWEARQEEIDKMVNHFMDNLKATSRQLREAEEGGYAKQLLIFASACARIQAHTIEKSLAGVPYDGSALGYLTWNDDVKGFVNRLCEEAKQTNGIEFGIPSGALHYWQSHNAHHVLCEEAA